MKAEPLALLVAWLCTAAAVMADEAQPDYSGICEASAAVFLGRDDGTSYFAVASDEVNLLRSYALGAGGKGETHDLATFTGHEESDLEGGARVGDLVWWISSQSLTSGGKDRKERRILVATKLSFGSDGPKLAPVGMVPDLRDDLAAALGADKREIDVEALAAGPGTGLLIGLRSPLADGEAQVLPLRNPEALLEGAAPDFGPVLRVDLGGYGLRSLERLSDGTYLAVAGPVADGSAEFRLYLWDGSSGNASAIATPSLRGLRPEAAFQTAEGEIMLLSDDGDGCEDLGTADDDDDGAKDRHFRWVALSLP